MKWVVASDHDQPNRPLSQEIATNGARGMNWLQDWVHDFDALSALYWLSAAFSDSHYGSSRDDCSTRASNCREVWASSKCAGYRISTLNLVTGWSPHCWQRSSGHILLIKGSFMELVVVFHQLKPLEHWGPHHLWSFLSEAARSSEGSIRDVASQWVK